MGMFDLGGVPAAAPQGGGILGGMGNNFQGLGILAAGLRDAGAYFSGRPEAAGSLLPAIQQRQALQQQNALLGALSSQDPATRQQAYAYAALNGVDTKPFQQQQAASALPKLLQSMQPHTENVAPTAPVSLPNLPGQSVQGGGFSFQAPGLGMSDALAQSGSPELQALYGPKLIDSQIAADAKANEPYTLNPGDHRFVGGQDVASLPFKPTPNEPFNPDGTPNLGYQKYQKDLKTAEQAPQWARLAFDRQKLQQGIPDEGTLHDMATRFVNGDRQAAVGLSRNPAVQSAFQNMVSQVGRERGLSQDQISRNLQTFQAGTKAVAAFDTGKQGDTTRSLNVSVAHLNTLKDLGAALQNGDITLINAAKQKFAEAFGVPAPTNFDAARAIVADEVAKGVIGGQTAQADREALASSLRRERSPQAINGAIGTFQNLLAGQLHGLRQQYKSSTGRDDFNDKLFPETISVLEGAHPKQGAQPPVPQDLPRVPPPAPQGFDQTATNPKTGQKIFHMPGKGWIDNSGRVVQ